MATQQLSLSNVINISVTETPIGLSVYNTSNLALFSSDTPSPVFTDGYKIYKEPTEVATDFGSSSITAKMATAIFAQNPNILLPGGYLVIFPFAVSETLSDAIVRTKDIVQYFGVMSTLIETQTDMLAAAATIQALNKIGFFVQRTSADIAPGGSLDQLRTGLLTQSRGLIYIDTATNALLYQAAYAGRALSTVFSGSRTVQNMHLKQLATIQPDPGMTQTFLNAAQLAGADAYVSLQGFSAVFSSGANDWFDNQYNLQWFSGALQVAGFNFLASSSTIIPQTEQGMAGLVGAYAAVCQQAVNNGYFAPGVWNSPTTFGNQTSLIANIQNFGFYIFSSPIATQLQVDRIARRAPLVQIAGKTSGGINSSTVIAIVNQ